MVYDASDSPYRVYCDFTSEPGYAYTMVTSWQFQNRYFEAFNRVGYSVDKPVNEYNPNWSSYRMSYSHMLQLKKLSQITHWRIVCNLDLSGMKTDYYDYLRSRFDLFDILQEQVVNFYCKKVEYVNIQGSGCSDCKIAFYQSTSCNLVAEPYYSSKCGITFKYSNGRKPINSEDSFGHYNTISSAFRCTNSRTSTTSIWFGGRLENC